MIGEEIVILHKTTHMQKFDIFFKFLRQFSPNFLQTVCHFDVILSKHSNINVVRKSQT